MKKLITLILLLVGGVSMANADGDVWRVTGSEDLTGSNWSLTDDNNIMTLTDGIYYWEKALTPATETNYKFKVTKNGTYDGAKPSSDYVWTLPAGSYNAVIAFNGSNDPYAIGSVALKGSWDSWAGELPLTRTSGLTYTGEYTIDTANPEFKLVTDKKNWFGRDELNLVGEQLSTKTGDNTNIFLDNSTYKTYRITASYNLSSSEWTLKMEPKYTYSVTFVNSEEWTEVAAYVWNGDGGSAVKIEGEWPGRQIYSTGTYSYKEKDYNVYTYTLETYDSAPEKIIFNNNKAGDDPDKKQTGTLIFENGKQYRYGLPAGKYVLAGSNSTIFPSGWAAENSTQELTDNGDGTYSYTLSDIALNADDSFEFKVVDIANSSLIYYPSASNVSYTVKDAATYDFDIVFNPTTPSVNITGKRHVQIDAAGFTSFSSAHYLDWSTVENAAPYMATLTGETGNKKALLSKVTATNAGQGALIKGTPNAIAKPVIASVDNTFEGNLFVATNGAISASTDGSYNYVYSAAPNPGFYKLASKLDAEKVKANGAYLHTTEPLAEEATSRIGWIFDDEVTGINQIENTQPATVKNTVVYNLNGQRVMNPAKGLYIVNGKKVIIK